MSDYTPLSSFSGTKLPLRPMHVWGIRVRLQVERKECATWRCLIWRSTAS